uniref:Secreted protein n=1 Tax=Rhipicephalus appendiculatus TaxID=34631 RepID=A0A131YDB2_RHIAP
MSRLGLSWTPMRTFFFFTTLVFMRLFLHELVLRSCCYHHNEKPTSPTKLPSHSCIAATPSHLEALSFFRYAILYITKKKKDNSRLTLSHCL